MPAIRLGGDEQPWEERERGPTARLRSRPAEIGGVETRAVSAAGEGAATVLLHGWLDNADTWLAVLDRLAVAGHPAIAYDLPGFGTAPALGSGSVLDQLVDFTAAAVESAAEASGREVVVAGNSLGGWVALRLAAGSRPAARRDRPDRPGGRADGAGVLHPRPDPGGLADHRPPGAGAAGGRPLGRRRPLSPARLRRPGAASTRRSSTASPAFTSIAP